jgi:hypothetical protein
MFESLINERRQCKYTVEQAFRGIQAFVSENCGEKVVLELDAPLTNYEQAARDSHECPLQFLEALASYFQFEWSESRWGLWLQLRDDSLKTKRERQAAWEHWQQAIAPQITVRTLAELVARKAQAPSFEPVAILGSTCEPAGVFIGLCCLPEAEKGRYAPSTPLRALKSSQRIRDLWKRAEWINGVKLPKLDEPSAKRLNSAADAVQLATLCLALPIAVGFGVLLADICCVYIGGYWDLVGWGGGVVAFVASLCIGFDLADRVHNPLPEGIERFGDLARLIVKQRQQPI